MRFAVAVLLVLSVSWAAPSARRLVRARRDRRLLVSRRHAQGRELTRERLVIHSSVDPDTLRNAVVAAIGLPYDRSTAERAELVQGPVTPGHVQFCYGTRRATVFTAGMRIDRTDSGGSVLSYGVEEWTSAEELVACVPKLRFLRRRIEEEARRTDPQVDVTTSAPARAGARGVPTSG